LDTESAAKIVRAMTTKIVTIEASSDADALISPLSISHRLYVRENKGLPVLGFDVDMGRRPVRSGHTQRILRFPPVGETFQFPSKS
jgi:hypothetical protein